MPAFHPRALFIQLIDQDRPRNLSLMLDSLYQGFDVIVKDLDSRVVGKCSRIIDREVRNQLPDGALSYLPAEIADDLTLVLTAKLRELEGFIGIPSTRHTYLLQRKKPCGLTIG